MGKAALLALLLAGGTAAQSRPGDASSLIDTHLIDLWKKEGIARAPRARDTEFLRRLCLDLVGEVPTPQEIREFAASEHPEKHARKVEELLRSPWFARSWAERMANFLLGTARQFDYFTDRKGLVKFLQERLADPDARFSTLAREVLTASSERNLRALGFLTQFAEFEDRGYRLKIEQVVGRVSTAFLGLRLQCAQCHDHPFDRWTQDEFRGLAAFFSKTGFSIDPEGMSNQLRLVDSPKPFDYAFEGLQKLPDPVFLDGRRPEGEDWREEFARLLISHPQFARAFVNRVWAWFFGKGFVDPLDEMTDSRKPAAPALLDALAKDFSENGFNIRRLIRSICASEAYALSSRRGKEEDRRAERLFARMRIRPLTPEQLFQSISRITDLVDANSSLDDEAILDLLGGQNQTGETAKYHVVRRWFVDMMVKTSDLDAGSNFSAYTANVQQVLYALNKDLPLFTGAKAKAGGRLQRLLERPDTDEVIEEMYLATVARPPSDRERARCLDHVRRAGGREKGLEEVFWALLNTDEFVFNH